VQAYNSGGASGYSKTTSAKSDEVASIHIGDLEGSSSSSNPSRWDATVSILVVDIYGDPVEGATVTGDWIDGASGSSSVVTGADGWCEVTKSNIKSNVSSVTFTVTNVQHGSDIYDSGSNEDPDGDSDGTTITILKP